MSPRRKRMLYWTGSACSLLTAIILPVVSPLGKEWIVYPIIGLLLMLSWLLAFLGGRSIPYSSR